MRPSRLAFAVAATPLLASAALVAPAPGAAAAGAQVLLVGTYHGIPGAFTNIQAAVDAASPGDYVLVAPGVYHEKGHATPTDPKEKDAPAGVFIDKPGITLRGMDRTTVIVDGSNGPSTLAGACPTDTASQDLGPIGADGKPMGRNGIEDWKGSGVAIENLTVCNYLGSAAGNQGNEIWWNFGDGSGTASNGITFSGAYLTATSTYFKDTSSPMGMYGIFTSNADADPAHPAVIAHTYASNMGDSAYYIGACNDCNQVLDDAYGYHSALGFSGTNAGGNLLIENGTWTDNQSGIVPNALNNDDAPPPPDGGCLQKDGTKPLGSHCTIISGNHVFNNNNPNVPKLGIAGAAPVGTGIELSGTRNQLVENNLVEQQGAWGILLHDYPDTETPPAVSQCQGGIPANQSQSFCYFQSFANEVRGNRLYDNGFFGNPSNSDLADVTSPNQYANCFHDNVHVDSHGNPDGLGVTSDPPMIQTLMGTCGQPGAGDLTVLLAEVVCDSGAIVPCPNAPGATYPRMSTITAAPLPTGLATMPDPCAGVPANPWCAAGSAPSTTGSGNHGRPGGSSTGPGAGGGADGHGNHAAPSGTARTLAQTGAEPASRTAGALLPAPDARGPGAWALLAAAAGLIAAGPAALALRRRHRRVG